MYFYGVLQDERDPDFTATSPRFGDNPIEKYVTDLTVLITTFYHSLIA